MSEEASRALIRELDHGRRPASPEDVVRIRDLMATAPFDPAIVRVATNHREQEFRGAPIGRLAPAIVYHLVKRTAIERQWAGGLSESAFQDDLTRSILAPTSRLLVYERRGGLVTATVTPTTDALATERLGEAFLPNLIVAYSADRDIIVTGYQFSTLDRISIPRGARWLT